MHHFRFLTSVVIATFALNTLEAHGLPLKFIRRDEAPATVDEAPAAVDEAPAAAEAAAASVPSNLSPVKLTYYWIKYQRPIKDEGSVQLRSCDGKTVFGTSSQKFAEELRMEGTGHLLNGKMLNLGNCNCGEGTNTFNCFMDVSKNKKAPFGYGVQSIPLKPWSSVANNDKNRRVGSVLYAPDLDGFLLPNGRKHNGCLRKVDHIGRGGKASHIDFFAVHEKLAYDYFMKKIKKNTINVEWDSPKCRNALLDWGVDPNDTVEKFLSL